MKGFWFSVSPVVVAGEHGSECREISITATWSCALVRTHSSESPGSYFIPRPWSWSFAGDSTVNVARGNKASLPGLWCWSP